MPQRLALARRHVDAVLERAEDAARRELREVRRDLAEVRGLVERAVHHPLQQRLLAQRDDDRVRRARAAPPAHPARLLAVRADETVAGAGAHVLLGLAVEALADEQRPREHLHVRRRGRRVVHRDVDDERHDAVVQRAVRHVERLGHAQVRRDRELRDLRVRHEREVARDLVREQRLAAARAVRDLVRAEDDLIGVGVPQPANPALGRRRRERLEIAERQPERRLFLAEHVRAELVPLSIEGRSHAPSLYRRAAERAS